MRPRRQNTAIGLALGVMLLAGAKPSASTVPKGRQYVLTIGGDNTVTFVPQANVPPFTIDYKAQVEYIVNTRTAQELEASKAAAARKKPARKTKARAKAKAEEEESEPPPKVGGVVDLSLHSAEFQMRRNEQSILASRLSRKGFQGRFQPGGPMLNVTYNNAPDMLKERLKRMDTPVASILLDENSRVLDRRVIPQGPMFAIIETLLSIHTPIPKDAAFWEAPTQLAMGHGQTAKGKLRFEKVKQALDKTAGLVNVKVSGTLKAEGAVVGRLIKDGNYIVTGEQSYDPKSREWKTARWAVVVDTELADQTGTTVAHAKGKMIVQSRALAEKSPPPPTVDETRGEIGVGEIGVSSFFGEIGVSSFFGPKSGKLVSVLFSARNQNRDQFPMILLHLRTPQTP